MLANSTTSPGVAPSSLTLAAGVPIIHFSRNDLDRIYLLRYIGTKTQFMTAPGDSRDGFRQLLVGYQVLPNAVRTVPAGYQIVESSLAHWAGVAHVARMYIDNTICNVQDVASFAAGYLVDEEARTMEAVMAMTLELRPVVPEYLPPTPSLQEGARGEVHPAIDDCGFCGVCGCFKCVCGEVSTFGRRAA